MNGGGGLPEAMDRHAREVATHLPECPGNVPLAICICDRLRACEARKDDECEHHNHDSFALGRAEARAEIVALVLNHPNSGPGLAEVLDRLNEIVKRLDRAESTEWHSLTEVAALRGVTRQRVQQMVASGELPAVRIGNTWAVRASDATP